MPTIPDKQESRAAQPKSTAEGVKDTVESIVVAFILAFVFRAFIIEAFVIPTGSMAATLYGAQVTHTCSTCGYEYAVGSGPAPNATERWLCCPNCAARTDNLKPTEVANPDSGDRILVHKWPFHLPGKRFEPRRWDVTVFKDPSDGQTNYIKRMIGLPGEVLEIIDGDVYTAPLDRLEARDPKLLEELNRLRADIAEAADNSHSRVDCLQRSLLLNQRLIPLLQIERKPPRAQQSLWSVVYNHDFMPNYNPLRANQSDYKVGWMPEPAAVGAWDVSHRQISFSSDSDDWLAIRFSGKPIDDFYAYNNDSGSAPGARGEQNRNIVGDVRLRFTWFPDAGREGALRLTINRDLDYFVATLGADGTVTLTREARKTASQNEAPNLIGELRLPAFVAGQAVPVEFINVDYQVSLTVAGSSIVTTDAQYAPISSKLANVAREQMQEAGGLSPAPTEVLIAARRLQCRFRHLALDRDVYYLSTRQQEPCKQNAPSVRNPYYNWPGWGTAGFPILLLGDREKNGRLLHGEYFMLGDNSPASKDSRLWWEVGPHLEHLGHDYQMGTVPADQLIGKAFFVYWPAGYRPAWADAVGWIPNVGRMRWIR